MSHSPGPVAWSMMRTSPTPPCQPAPISSSFVAAPIIQG
jgi:hypothetical protein